MLGECELEFHRPLQAEVEYVTSVIINDLVRSESRTSTVLDRLVFTVTLAEPGADAAATVKLTWLLPRGVAT
jgi:hypothetical protein